MTLKETYYTHNNIHTQAKQFKALLAPLTSRHNIKLDLKKSALLVIDMQEVFADPCSKFFLPSSEAIVPIIKDLQDLFLANNLPVIQTVHHNTLLNGKNMIRWWGKGVLSEKKDKVISALRDSRAHTFIKPQYCAFHKTTLDQVLKENHASQVVITGVLTHICCETTARSAFMKGYDVFSVIDGTATDNKDFHLGSLRNLADAFARVLLAEEIVL